MNIKISFTLILIFILFTNLVAQQRYKNRPFKFSMEKPIGNWKETNLFNNFLQKIGGFEFTNNNLVQFMEDNFEPGYGGNRARGLVEYRSYEKYYPFLRLNATLQECYDFEEFTDKATNMKSYFIKEVPKDLTFDIPPKIIEISGIKSLTFTFSFNNKQSKEMNQVRIMMCLIPMGEYYFTLSCNDYPSELDFTEIFEQVIKSIKIGD